VKRLTQLAIIVICGYLCFLTMRPFLTQIDLERGRRMLKEAAQAAAGKRRLPRGATADLWLRQAQRFLRRAMRTTLGNGEVWLHLAASYRQSIGGKKRVAAETRRAIFGKVVRLIDEGNRFYLDPAMNLFRGSSYLGLGNIRAAIGDLETALHYNPTWSVAIGDLSKAYLVELTRKYRKEPKRLARLLERLSARFPTSREVTKQLGKVYLIIRDPVRARKCFRRLQRPRVYDLTLGQLISRSYTQQREFRRAIWELCRILIFSRKPKAKELAPIFREIERLLKRDPKNSDAYFLMGLAQQTRLADYNVAKQHYIAALSIRPDYYCAARRLADVCAALGEKEIASRWSAVADQIAASATTIRVAPVSGKEATRACLAVFEVESASPRVGQVVEDAGASGGKALLLRSGSWPSTPVLIDCSALPAGFYEVLARFKIPSPPKPGWRHLATVRVLGDNVVAYRGTRQARRYVRARDFVGKGKYMDVGLKFFHPGLVDYTIKIDCLGACDIYLDRIAVSYLED